MENILTTDGPPLPVPAAQVKVGPYPVGKDLVLYTENEDGVVTHWVANADNWEVRGVIHNPTPEVWQLAQQLQDILDTRDAFIANIKSELSLWIRECGELKAERSKTEDSVFELWLCEASCLFLKPNRLYRFTADPTCELCIEAEKNA